MNQVRQWRIKRGLTLEQLAEKSGVNRDTISRIENGRKAMHLTLGKLATALQVEPEELYRDEGTPDLPRQAIEAVNRRGPEPTTDQDELEKEIAALIARYSRERLGA